MAELLHSEVSHGKASGVTRIIASRIWDLLTRPSAAVACPEARRRARALAGILLFLIIAAAMMTWVLPWAVAPDEVAANAQLAVIGFASVGSGLGIYVLARSRRHGLAAGLTVFATMAACTLAIVLTEGSVWAQDAPFFLALSVILSSILLSLRTTFFVIAGNLSILALFDQALPSFGAMDLSNSVAFLAFVSVLLLVATIVRHLDLDQIRNQADELRASEKRYRSLFEASFEGIVLHEDGMIIETNNALTEMIGISRDELVGTPLRSIAVADSQPHVANKSQTSVDETNEAVARRGDGSTFPVEFVSKPYLHEGRLVRATAFRDITARREAEIALERSRELAAANERLQEIDRLKTHILNTASHELNTPITPLRLQIHLLKEGRLGSMNDKQVRAVGILHRNLARLDHLVKDMLDVSRLESGRFELEKTRVDLSALVQDAVEAYHDLAVEQGVVLDASVEEGIWVEGDHDRLLQVLYNLLSNAVKFTPPDETIVVRCQRDRAHVLVDVEDSGIGLSAEQRARLFQPFGQVHDAMQRTERGSGLGLYISKGIVQQHGGEMRASSDGPGRGSTFTMVLPLPRVDAGAPEGVRRKT